MGLVCSFGLLKRVATWSRALGWAKACFHSTNSQPWAGHTTHSQKWDWFLPRPSSKGAPEEPRWGSAGRVLQTVGLGSLQQLCRSPGPTQTRSIKSQEWAFHQHETSCPGFSCRKVKVLLTQSCPTLCDPKDCSPPGSSVFGILQARILDWVAMPSSRRSFQPKDQTRVIFVSCFGRRVPYYQHLLGSLPLLWPHLKEMATHSSTPAWKIPWTQKLGRLQSMGLQRVGHDWATSLTPNSLHL